MPARDTLGDVTPTPPQPLGPRSPASYQLLAHLANRPWHIDASGTSTLARTRMGRHRLTPSPRRRRQPRTKGPDEPSDDMCVEVTKVDHGAHPPTDFASAHKDRLSDSTDKFAGTHTHLLHIEEVFSWGFTEARSGPSEHMISPCTNNSASGERRASLFQAMIWRCSQPVCAYVESVRSWHGRDFMTRGGWNARAEGRSYWEDLPA